MVRAVTMIPVRNGKSWDLFGDVLSGGGSI
jgi:hypothetical protein